MKYNKVISSESTYKIRGKVLCSQSDFVEGGVRGTVASTVVVSSFGGFLDGEGGGVVIVNVSMMMHE